MSIYSIEERKTFLFSAENPNGVRNGGTKGKDCKKLRPCVTLKPSDTLTHCQVAKGGIKRRFNLK